MSDNDFFVDEVNDEVRSENMRKLINKIKWPVIIVIIGVVLAVAFHEFRKNQMAKEGADRFQALIAAQNGEGSDFLSTDTQSVSRIAAAKLALEQGDTADAISKLDAVASDRDADRSMRDYAAFLGYAIDPTRAAGALVNPNAPYRMQVQLIQADRALNAGERQDAVDILEKMLTDDQVGAQRPLIENLVITLGGEIPGSDEIPTEDTVTENLSEVQE